MLHNTDRMTKLLINGIVHNFHKVWINGGTKLNLDFSTKKTQTSRGVNVVSR